MRLLNAIRRGRQRRRGPDRHVTCGHCGAEFAVPGRTIGAAGLGILRGLAGRIGGRFGDRIGGRAFGAVGGRGVRLFGQDDLPWPPQTYGLQRGDGRTKVICRRCGQVHLVINETQAERDRRLAHKQRAIEQQDARHQAELAQHPGVLRRAAQRKQKRNEGELT